MNHPSSTIKTAKTKLSHRLILWFLLLALIPMVIVSYVSYERAGKDLTDATIFRLKQSSDLKARFIRNWFDYRVTDISAQAESRANADMLAALVSGMNSSGKSIAEYVKSYDWAIKTSAVQSDIVTLSHRYDYIYDLFLIDKQGNIIYTVVREPDLGTNLFTGPYSKTLFAEATQKTLATGKTIFSDIERYGPSNDEFASFLTSPLLDQWGEVIGVFAIQLRMDRIFNVMASNLDKDTSEQHYLVGEDSILRSAVKNDWDSVLRQKLALDFFNEHTAETHATPEIEIYAGINGKTVLGIHTEIRILNKRWLLVSEIDVDEVHESPQVLAQFMLLMGSFTALLVALIAVLISRRIIQPIEQLTEASVKISAGESSQPVAIVSNDEIGRLADNFNRMVSSREQYETELIEAKIEAENAARIKSDFLASMSHEIRTPMNGVLGMLGLLLNGELSNDQRHRIEVAQSSAKSLLTLINDILDFSKVDAGKLELEELDFNLRGMLGEFIESLGHQAQNKDLELIIDTTHVEESMVNGDPGRLRQILTNIVGNAIKFTEKGEVIVTASLHQISDDLLQFKCEIKDTGIGIPQDKITSLFDSFSQVDSSTTRKFGGTGLGLAIVKKLCELMHGSISVTSELNQGSCFKIEVQLKTSHKSEPIIPLIDMRKLNLLIVDDNQTNLEVLRSQLEHWGATVTEADSAEKALQLCEDRLSRSDTPFFDIALLDMQMPDMDGAELGQKLKADSRFAAMKLVMMTSMGHANEADYFAQLGFNAYFPKPVTTMDLFKALSVISEDTNPIWKSRPIVTSNFLSTVSTEEEHNIQYHWPKNTRLLLVEDNQINQVVAQGILEDYNLYADIANNGLEALDSLKAAQSDTPYTLILMDCQMPEMDGYETSRQIRSSAAGDMYKNIPIIAMTANAMLGDRKKCLDAGMSDYLSKPVDSHLLAKKLHKWLIKDVGALTTNNTTSTIEIDDHDYEQPPVENPVWDKAAALKRVRNKPERLQTLIDMYLDGAEQRLQELQQAIDSDDSAQVKHVAHTLKGVAANLGGLQLQTVAAEMELSGSENDIDKSKSLLEDLLHQEQHFREALTEN